MTYGVIENEKAVVEITDGFEVDSFYLHEDWAGNRTLLAN